MFHSNSIIFSTPSPQWCTLFFAAWYRSLRLPSQILDESLFTLKGYRYRGAGDPTFISSVKMVIFTILWYIPQISLFESIILSIDETTASYLI